MNEQGEILALKAGAERLFGSSSTEVLGGVRQPTGAAAGIVLAASPVSQLPERELRIMRLFSEEKNSPEIAKQLWMSPQTLRNHLHPINQRLHTHERREAVMHAIRRKRI